MLKRGLKTLNTQAFHNIVTEADEDRNTLKQIQVQLQRCPTNVEYQQAEISAYQKFRQSSYLAEVYLQQMSKATWIRLGDDNTKYFHSVIKHRKLKQAITQLKDSSGLWQTYLDTIAGIFVDYYKNLLGRKATERVKAFSSIIKNGNSLSEAQQQEIMQPFLEREVKQAMFQIDNNKSPGPDGFGSGFYKAAWPIVGREITATVL
ncbi:PREDICTED: uncharacterized protein LOC109205144 [Nicotiana attenuata]|uniref:uncharacterized protein LOC109205144 n=1 Tax=Nicotiana attenuata TaxID=49451 RepID=UPI000905BB48|nr:PREDICTED: uncharacterized protein LOC109205144 [Nicotiana attenuata]